MKPYADSAALAAYLGASAPADAARLLERASDLMDATCIGAYAVDAEGIPSEPAVAAALSQAVCAQVELWLEAGEGNDVDGLAGTSYSLAGYAGQRPARLAPRALDALRGAGLLTPCHGLGVSLLETL